MAISMGLDFKDVSFERCQALTFKREGRQKKGTGYFFIKSNINNKKVGLINQTPTPSQ